MDLGTDSAQKNVQAPHEHLNASCFLLAGIFSASACTVRGKETDRDTSANTFHLQLPTKAASCLMTHCAAQLQHFTHVCRHAP